MDLTQLRAGDADRDTAIEELSDALGEGRLSIAEYEQRLGQASAAVTIAQLQALTADLPPSQAAAAKAAAAHRDAKERADRREWLGEWRYWLGGALIMTVIWGVEAVRERSLEFYWPAVPLGIWAAILVSYALWPGDRS